MNKKGQATVEYLLLISVVAIIFWHVVGRIQGIFYGSEDGSVQGAIELFLGNQTNKLSLNNFSLFKEK